MSERLNRNKEITYPRTWLYKIIGTDRSSVETAAAEIIGQDVTIIFSNMSSKGKYLAFNLEVLVADREERDDIYRRLKQHPAVKTVI